MFYVYVVISLVVFAGGMYFAPKLQAALTKAKTVVSDVKKDV